MTDKEFDEVEFAKKWPEFKAAIGAVIARAKEKDQLYDTVIADQLLYVAASLMLEHRDDEDGVALQKWCDKEIQSINGMYNKGKAFIRKLVEQKKK